MKPGMANRGWEHTLRRQGCRNLLLHQSWALGGAAGRHLALPTPCLAKLGSRDSRARGPQQTGAQVKFSELNMGALLLRGC